MPKAPLPRTRRAEVPAETTERVTANLDKELAAIVGTANVLADKSLADCAIDGVMPAAIVSPESNDEIAEILHLANEKDYVVVATGGMTKQNVGALPERVDILLKTNRLNRVLHYDAGDLTLGVGAGMTTAEVQKALAANSQFLPLDPILPERATIGGVLATNANGPMRSG